MSSISELQNFFTGVREKGNQVAADFFDTINLSQTIEDIREDISEELAYVDEQFAYRDHLSGVEYTKLWSCKLCYETAIDIVDGKFG